MSADDITIGRLKGRLRSPHALSDDDLRRWRDTVAEADLPDLDVAVSDPEEWLLIRHLDLSLRWRPDGPRSEAGQAWAQALQSAVREVASQPGHPDVVRYRGRRQALADLIYRSALGETRRQWAWRRMGWLDAAPVSASQALSQGLSQLRAQPGWVWPVLRQWVAAEAGTGALSALLRTVPPAEWQAWLGTAVASRPYAVLQWRGTAYRPHEVGVSLAPGADAGLPGDTDGPQPPTPPALNTDAQLLSGWLASRPWLAVAHGEVLAVLLAAIAWPDQGSGVPLVRQRLDAAWRMVRRAAADAPRPAKAVQGEPGAPTAQPAAMASQPTAPATSPHAADQVEAAPVSGQPPAHEDDDLPLAPALPDPELWQATAWAGALFWLRALEAPGLLDELMGPTGQSADARGHALMALARALGVPDDDATLRAFVGGVLPQGQPQPGLAEAARAQAARWGTWLDEVAPELAEPRLRTVCRRPGRLRFEPGWIELHMPLDQVDTRIRRLGLDLDPGYLAWLGCVLRIRYE